MEWAGADADLMHAHVRMPARPASVPAARRFVDQALTGWGARELVDDVALCVTELSTNVTLHSRSRFFDVELRKVAEAVRLAVRDTGDASVEAIAGQLEIADALVAAVTPDEVPATGRGMFIVSVLATSWGIDELPDGKRVWAEFSPSGPGRYDAQPPEVSRRDDPVPERLYPDDWVLIGFHECPAALLLAHDDNIAEAIRELQLIGSEPERAELRRLGEQLAGFVQRHAVTWDAARLQAMAAVRDGQEFTDITVLAPAAVASELQQLRYLVGAVERLARAGQLMTLPAPPAVQDLRDWMEAEFVEQSETGREPRSYRSWSAARPG